MARPEGLLRVLVMTPFPTQIRCLRPAFPFPTRATPSRLLLPRIMGRKLDPTKKEKRGPGRKARKQKGAETELARFLPAGEGQACSALQPVRRLSVCIHNLHFTESLRFPWKRDLFCVSSQE